MTRMTTNTIGVIRMHRLVRRLRAATKAAQVNPGDGLQQVALVERGLGGLQDVS